MILSSSKMYAPDLSTISPVLLCRKIFLGVPVILILLPSRNSSCTRSVYLPLSRHSVNFFTSKPISCANGAGDEQVGHSHWNLCVRKSSQHISKIYRFCLIHWLIPMLPLLFVRVDYENQVGNTDRPSSLFLRKPQRFFLQ
jgi:hypothetical protein